MGTRRKGQEQPFFVGVISSYSYSFAFFVSPLQLVLPCGARLPALSSLLECSLHSSLLVSSAHLLLVWPRLSSSDHAWIMGLVLISGKNPGGKG